MGSVRTNIENDMRSRFPLLDRQPFTAAASVKEINSVKGNARTSLEPSHPAAFGRITSHDIQPSFSKPFQKRKPPSNANSKSPWAVSEGS